jgi:2-polyprenyl-6-methoxyphenol hydroxylase-like FAD-dependent oxidoreductase
MKPQRFVILGGGTAGWIAANMLLHRWPDLDLTVIEDPEIGTIGVGEGSTPSFKRFFETMGMAEADWMPQCHATYKTNIRFIGWSPTWAAEYSHPFATQLDLHTEPAFVANCSNRRLGHDVPTSPDAFWLNARLAAEKKAPLAPPHFPFVMEYGYHFDSGLLGQLLRDRAVAQGARHMQDRVLEAQRSPQGDVAQLRLARGGTIAGDIFIDCSGFASQLLRQTLGVGFRSFKDNLFNDSAVVIPTPMGDEPPVETTSTTLRHGWAWAIPLTKRCGNGYVFSSDFVGADAAETELRAHLGLLDSDTPARHLRFETGQLERHWDHNCLAIGLSQGFIEPLEATAIHLVLGTVEMFMEHYERGGFSVQHREAFNAAVRDRIERVRDYIVAHYKLNTRQDSEYWRANAENMALSLPLREILDVWFRRGDLQAELARQNSLSHFNSASWHCLLAGYGAFPPVSAEYRGEFDFHAAQGIAPFLIGCTLNFPSQKQALARFRKDALGR